MKIENRLLWTLLGIGAGHLIVYRSENKIKKSLAS